MLLLALVLAIVQTFLFFMVISTRTLTRQDQALRPNRLLIARQMRSTSDILAKMSLVLPGSQLAAFDKNSWSIVAAGKAGGLDCIMSNSTIFALSSGIRFSAERGRE